MIQFFRRIVIKNKELYMVICLVEEYQVQGSLFEDV